MDEAETAVSEWFEGRPRVLFVHAHPDDETITTGGTLAALAEAGREPLLVTLTRGEQGEVVPGPLEALAAQHGLAVVRQNELQTAIGMLGLERHVFLGVEPARAEGLSPAIYEDSGMSWGADGRATAAPDAGPDALTSVPAIEPLNDLLAAAYLSGAQAIVSYDDGGGYGHPDHVFAHRIGRAVAAALEVPFWQILSPGGPADAPGGAGSAGPDGAAIPADPAAVSDDGADPRVVEAHDVTPWLDRKLAALRAHTTQLTVEPSGERASGYDIVHVGGQREPVAVLEVFERLG